MQNLFFILVMVIFLSSCGLTRQSQYGYTSIQDMKRVVVIDKKISFTKKDKNGIGEGLVQTLVVATKDEDGFSPTKGDKVLYSDIYLMFVDMPTATQLGHNIYRALVLH